MKKRFKLLNDKRGRILLLKWETDGVLFGPDWGCIAAFDNTDNNLERCKTIIRLMNECDKHTDHPNNDRTRNPKN